jgi:hypothetical protein
LMNDPFDTYTVRMRKHLQDEFRGGFLRCRFPATLLRARVAKSGASGPGRRLFDA